MGRKRPMSKSALIAYAMVPVLFLVSMAMIPGFGSPLSVVSLLVIGSLLGIASIGQTLTIVLGGIDLSIPAVIGLANVLTVRWYGDGLAFRVVVLWSSAIALGDRGRQRYSVARSRRASAAHHAWPRAS